MVIRLKSDITIGADPELFLKHSGTGYIVSAHDIVPGSKASPVLVPKGAVQVDGTAAEFNVDPTSDPDVFLDNLKSVMSTLGKIVSEQRPSLYLVAQPTAQYDPVYWENLPDEVKELGCDPDFDAWRNGEVNKKPDMNVTFRTGGGHIHIGWTTGKQDSDITHFHECMEVVKQLDTVLYIPSLMWDSDKERRKLYGRRGAFRPKPYGVEYRPLSNAWVADPALATWVFEQAQEAAISVLSERTFLYEEPEAKAVLAIPDDKLTRDDIRSHLWWLMQHGFNELPEPYMHFEDLGV